MKIAPIAGSLVFLLAAAVGTAQQTVPFRGTTPVAPSGIPAKPLPDSPVEFDTAEGQRIRVVPVVTGLVNPWSLAFLPDGGMLVTERGGQLRVIRNGVLDPTAAVDRVLGAVDHDIGYGLTTATSCRNGADELLYVLTDDRNGALLRIEPAP